MEFLARLVHADATTRIVEVQARADGRLLGSALGEAGTAEDAEARALERLRSRLRAGTASASASTSTVLRQGQTVAPGIPEAGPGERPASIPNPPAAARVMPSLPERPRRPLPSPSPAAGVAPGGPPEPMPGGGALPPQLRPPGRGTAEPQANPAAAPEAPQSRPGGPEPEERPELVEPVGPDPGEAEEPPADPEDWSEELVRLDLALRRLGWSREAEADYLMRAFGHPSRSRLTSYADLVAYLRQLEALEPGADPATTAVPLRRRDLLLQGDQLLQQLGWDNEQARACLRELMAVASRSQLNDEQLLRFNMHLEMELLNSSSGGGGGGPDPG